MALVNVDLSDMWPEQLDNFNHFHGTDEGPMGLPLARFHYIFSFLNV